MAIELLVSTPFRVTPEGAEIFHGFPSVGRAPGGLLWFSWVKMEGGRDAICARWMDVSAHPIRLSPVLEISSHCGVNFFPTLAAMPHGGAVITWSAVRNSHWHVLCRELQADGMGSEEMVRGGIDGWYPSCAVADDGSVWIAWISLKHGNLLVSARRKGSFTEPTHVSESGSACRPVVMACKHGLLLAWDEYVNATYQVCARVVRPDLSRTRIFVVSSGDGWEFLPHLGLDSDGAPLCCWLTRTEVGDHRGVIDQHFTVRCARFNGRDWVRVGEDVRGTVADLSHGLLHTEEARGYLGRRLFPVLRNGQDRKAWLCWERKIKAEAPTGAPGQLVARRLDGDTWSTPIVLHEGFAFYEIERACGGFHSAHGDGESVLWAAMRKPKGCAAWDIYVAPIQLMDPTIPAHLESADIRTWKPISLPQCIVVPPQRPSLCIGSKEYHLYFGDLHAHSGLSGDAEGEVDELIRYARDKAKLDFVAIIDNDCYEIPLTCSQFQISNTWADHFTEPGKFVVFPGYEWTLWEKEHCKHPDHRTIIYEKNPCIFRHTDARTKITQEMAHLVLQRGGLLFTQHWDWTLTDSDAECGLEVASAWDYYINRPEPFHRDLCSGRRLAFIGASDSHRRNPGVCGPITGVWAEGLSRQALFAALRARTCFATSGARIMLDVRVNEVPMGSDVTVTDIVHLRVRVWGTRPLEKLGIVRGIVGEPESRVRTIHVVHLQGMVADVSWDDDPPSGTLFYYVVVKQAGEDISYPSNICIAEGSRAWSSPIFVTKPSKRA